MKGTDHKGSLGVDGIHRMVRDIRNVEIAMGDERIFKSEAVEKTRLKLERSVASVRAIRAGEVIAERDLHLLSPGDGFKWVDRYKVIGKIAKTDIMANEIIYPHQITS